MTDIRTIRWAFALAAMFVPSSLYAEATVNARVSASEASRKGRRSPRANTSGRQPPRYGDDARSVPRYRVTRPSIQREIGWSPHPT